MASTKYTYKDYTESEKVRNAQAALENHNATKPGEYTSQWTGQMNDTLNKIQNRGPFSYDLASDALYQQYADRYAQLGKMAMQDTVGKAAALTGGYGNSYAVTAGNQAYQNYLQGINDIVPELQQMAYERYNQEGQNLLNLYGLYSDRENNDYARYQDTLTNWNNERAYLSDYYNNERTYDRGVYEGDRAFDYGKWTDDRNYNYQIERDKVTDEQWQKEFDESKRQFNVSLSASKSSSSSGGSNEGSDDNTAAEYHNFHTVEDAAKYLKERNYKLPSGFDGFVSSYEWNRQKSLGNSASAYKYDSYQDYLSAAVYYIETNQ